MQVRYGSATAEDLLRDSDSDSEEKEDLTIFEEGLDERVAMLEADTLAAALEKKWTTYLSPRE